MAIKNPRYARWWEQRKLRHPRGDGVPSSKLDTAAVLALRRRAQAGEAHAALALAYGVTTQTISNVVSGRAWAHLPLVPEGD